MLYKFVTIIWQLPDPT